jgi:multisubunit Na+/H+ antiporter MnhG subunit
MENEIGHNNQNRLPHYSRALARLVALTIVGIIGVAGILLSVINQNTESPDFLLGYLAIVVFGLVGVSFSAFAILRINHRRNQRLNE